MRMPLDNFISVYCADIVQLKESALDNPFRDFAFDEIVDGQSVIYDRDGHEIPVSEIVQLPFQEFVQRYPFSTAAEAFKNYVSAYNIVSGEDLINEVQVQMKRSRSELANYRRQEGDTFDL